ncbi:hypothetical protein [Streptomyces lydicus]|nr:hypothetical protein [Streptomyces lydicus]
MLWAERLEAWEKASDLRAKYVRVPRIAPREPRIITRRVCRRLLPVPPEALMRGPVPLPPSAPRE